MGALIDNLDRLHVKGPAVTALVNDALAMSPRSKLQIFDSIISPVAIDVMDGFVRFKGST